MAGWLIVAGDLVRHGGMDRANLELARFLAASEPVQVVAHRVDAELAAMPGVRVERVPRPWGRHLWGWPLLAWRGRRWAERLSREGYRVIVNGANCDWPDINWVHCVHNAYAAPATGGPWQRLKVLLMHRRECRRERRVIGAARVVVCNSRRTAADVQRYLGVPPERVRVVYLGIDPQEFPPVTAAERAEMRRKLQWEERPWAVFVGQLGNRIKGLDLLYAAWRQLCQEPGWDANLAVVGTGPTLAAWQRRAVAEGLDQRIRFLGFRPDVPAVLAAADLLVAPSRYDAYGLAVHEAVCRGLPVIVSAAMGISERFPPELAEWIVQKLDSPEELAERLRQWRSRLEDAAGRFRPLAEQLRAYSWADMARDFRRAVREGT